MPEQIRQEYSLDTSGAVQNLDNLCNAYGDAGKPVSNQIKLVHPESEYLRVGRY